MRIRSLGGPASRLKQRIKDGRPKGAAVPEGAKHLPSLMRRRPKVQAPTGAHYVRTPTGLKTRRPYGRYALRAFGCLHLRFAYVQKFE